jgi:uncharacterized caspase-like protein
MLAALLLLFAQPAAAPLVAGNPTEAAVCRGQVALAIGNDAYPEAPLRNAGRDAEGVAESLRRLGYEVEILRDAGRDATVEAIRRFAGQTRTACRAVLDFAGHGVTLPDGRAVLVPVAARWTDPAVLSAEVGIPLAPLIPLLRPARDGVVVLILDTHFPAHFGGEPAVVMPSHPNQLLAYAAAPDGLAQDGAGEHGPFAAALIAALATPGSSLTDLFQRVAADVRAATGGSQRPWFTSTLTEDAGLAAP